MALTQHICTDKQEKRLDKLLMKIDRLKTKAIAITHGMKAVHEKQREMQRDFVVLLERIPHVDRRESRGKENLQKPCSALRRVVGSQS